jgi:hypothetical protein
MAETVAATITTEEISNGIAKVAEDAGVFGDDFWAPGIAPHFIETADYYQPRTVNGVEANWWATGGGNGRPALIVRQSPTTGFVDAAYIVTAGSDLDAATLEAANRKLAALFV